MAVYFTADTHWGHANITKYCNRPFANVDEMDHKLLENVNAVVKPGDTLYHLGDFSFRGRNPSHYRDQIACQNIILIMGNHDKRQKNGKPDYDLVNCFNEVWDIKHTKIWHDNDKLDIFMCHYAMRVWNKSHHGAIHLYGHSHHSLSDDPCARSMDVGIDSYAARIANVSHEEIRDPSVKTKLNPSDYRPFSFAEILSIMSKKTFRPIDHHTGD